MKIPSQTLYLLPRILAIVCILFISMFALDAFNPKLTIWQQIVGFFMHLIPSFILIIILIIAWKKEFIGGVIFILLGLVFSPFIFIHNYRMNQSIWMSLLVIATITFPFILIGILFILSHKRRKKEATSLSKNG